MSTFFVDFTEYTLGAKADGTNGGIPGWTSWWWLTDDRYEIVTSGDDQSLQMQANIAGTAESVFTRDEVDGNDDIEILAKWKSDPGGFDLKINVSGAAGSEDYYALEANNQFDRVQIRQSSAGSDGNVTDWDGVDNEYPYVFDSTKWYWLRFRRNGQNLMGRVWADGEAEPTEWHVTASPAGYVSEPMHTGGSAGVGFRYEASTMDVDQVSFGTAGDTAPTVGPTNVTVAPPAASATADAPIPTISTVFRVHAGVAAVPMAATGDFPVADVTAANGTEVFAAIATATADFPAGATSISVEVRPVGALAEAEVPVPIVSISRTILVVPADATADFPIGIAGDATDLDVDFLIAVAGWELGSPAAKWALAKPLQPFVIGKPERTWT